MKERHEIDAEFMFMRTMTKELPGLPVPDIERLIWESYFEEKNGYLYIENPYVEQINSVKNVKIKFDFIQDTVWLICSGV